MDPTQKRGLLSRLRDKSADMLGINQSKPAFTKKDISIIGAHKVEREVAPERDPVVIEDTAEDNTDEPDLATIRVRAR